MRTLLLQFAFGITLLSISSCTQHKIPDVINNLKTDKHINIPGTHIFIIPPDDFYIDSTLCELKNNSGDIISITERPVNCKGLSRYSKEAYEKAGLKILVYKDILFNGYHCKYIIDQASSTKNECTLVFGDSSLEVFIFFNYNSKTTDLEGMTQSILSVVYDKGFKTDPYAKSYFTLNDSASKLKFILRNENTFIYMEDGSFQRDYYEPFPVLTIIPAPVFPGKFTMAGLLRVLYTGWNNTNLTNITIQDTVIKIVNGYRAYEGIACGKKSGQDALSYILLVNNNNRGVVISGVTRINLESSLTEFKKLAYTISFKSP